MTTSSSLSPMFKIADQEPFAKLGERRTYWIRVVADRHSVQPRYAIAAMRCENREELHWLSAGSSDPAEVARQMRSGFELPLGAGPVANEVLQELLKSGQAVSVDLGCAAAA